MMMNCNYTYQAATGSTYSPITDGTKAIRFLTDEEAKQILVAIGAGPNVPKQEERIPGPNELKVLRERFERFYQAFCDLMETHGIETGYTTDEEDSCFYIDGINCGSVSSGYGSELTNTEEKQ